MESKITMRGLPEEERPYEKCRRYGAEALSDAELLAVILRTGTRGTTSVELARNILDASASRKGLLGLHHLTIHELKRIPGVGFVKATQLKCIAELSSRIAQASAEKDLRFTDPADIAAYYMEKMRHLEQEWLLCLMLDTKSHLLGEKLLSVGTVNASLASPRELFIEAMRFEAVYIILVHNHPSGDAAPSRQDFLFTKRILQAGELLQIPLLDHIVIGDRQYVSFAEKNLFNEKTHMR